MTRSSNNKETKPTPSLVTALEGHKVVSAVAGWEFSVCLTDDGQLFSFGAGEVRFGPRALRGHSAAPLRSQHSKQLPPACATL